MADAVRTLVLLLALAGAGAQRAQAQGHVPPGYEEGLFDVTAPGLPQQSVPVLVTPRGKYLLPVRAILDPLGVPYRVASDSGVLRVTRPAGIGTASAWWIGARRLEVKTAAPLDSDDVYVDGPTIFLAATRFAELIEATVDIDVGTLTIALRRDGGFPAQIKLDARERRREEALRALGSEAELPTGNVPFRARTGAGVVEWGFGGPLHRTSAPSTLDLRGGMGLQGGMLQVHGTAVMGNAGGGSNLLDRELTYRRVFPGQRWVQQIQLGSVTSDGAEARPIQGITLTNAPFVRDLHFDEVAFSRPLPPGWEYEVYEGSQLVGFTDESRKGPMSVPLQYGTTPLRVRLYGPAGEIVESNVSYVIPVEQLRAGEWQYAAGAGRCALQCTGMWYADLRRGVTRELTLQAGADAQRDSGWQSVRPYGAVSYLPAPGWTADLQARRNSYLRGSVQSFTEGHVNGAVTAGLNLPGEGGVAISTSNDAMWFAQSTFRFRDFLPRLTQRSFLLSSRVEAPQHGGDSRWDVAATAPIRIGMLEVGVQSDPFAETGAPSGGPLLRLAPTIMLGSKTFRRLQYPIVRLEAGVQQNHLVQWESAISLQPGRGFVSLTLRHAPGLGGTQLALAGSYAVGLGRVIGRVTQHAGQIDGGYSASGAVAFGSVRRATPLEYGGLGLSGVEGHVFRDLDGDGKLGAHDEPVADATVRIGGFVTHTDANGRYSMWNVLPYQAVSVQIDTLSLQDPAWVPALPGRALRPSPQQFTSVDFGLVRTREIAGLLVPGAKLATAAGVGLELRDVDGGALTTSRTFSDGAFYFGRVRPGHYRLTVTKSSASALGITTPPQIDVMVGADSDAIIELKPITLERDAPASP
ncbi:MAG TPA: carboxypeptidase-like regulatory domain-containing protein [Gemmatimonadaceae bacterium]